MRDDGQMPAISQPKTEPGPTDTFRIEALDFYVSAGPGAINSEFVEVLRSVEYSVEDARRMFNGRKAEQIRIINVRGDSMSGTIEPGDLLFVDISVQQFDGDGIYAFIYDETSHVKRLQKMKDKLLVISDNQTYRPWEPDRKRRNEQNLRIRQGDWKHAADIQKTRLAFSLTAFHSKDYHEKVGYRSHSCCSSIWVYVHSKTSKPPTVPAGRV
ncbi:putative phage repressor protein CI [Enterobacter cancerogenus]|uniref:Putative phage repressor protein CI n=1 Tax=Enterobacter cancerogenus TaxID=69218 RepID=A0A484YDI0_9ENTR|nr:putative phage repressor protein CI [Enterobacter cancerogenus]